MPDDKAPTIRILAGAGPAPVDDRQAAIDALMEVPARIEPKYFYDELGCALYGAICRLPEYYPTRTEHAIFREHRLEIAQAVGSARQLVDLGAGDCCKAEGWIPFLNPSRYIAVDIAEAEIRRSLARIAPDFPETEMLGVVTDFARGLDVRPVLDARPVTFFYPGSSIGNFGPDDARRLLTDIRRQCVAPGSGLLIGVDAKKDRRVLEAAYDDALGVTAAFNRNALSHLNRRFGFDFQVEAFEHRALYNEALGRIEMHLESARGQVVHLGPRERRLEPRERIHTENSYKYGAGEFEALLRASGFDEIRLWTETGRRYFVFFAS